MRTSKGQISISQMKKSEMYHFKKKVTPNNLSVTPKIPKTKRDIRYKNQLKILINKRKGVS